MSIEQMKAILKKCPRYKQSWKWINKVNAMSDSQVVAVYYRMLNTGML